MGKARALLFNYEVKEKFWGDAVSTTEDVI